MTWRRFDCQPEGMTVEMSPYYSGVTSFSDIN